MKTQLQAQAELSIAVGTQHNIKSIPDAVKRIYREHGITGLWRGCTAAVARATIGSAVQLSSFSKCKDIIRQRQIFSDGSIMIPIASSMFASIFVVIVRVPFDLVSTRLYNQGVDKFGRGLLYNNMGDVFLKVIQIEGFFGLYKGIGSQYFRLGPHVILTLVVWDYLRQLLKCNQMSLNF